jgi:hypothetical protein
MKRLVFLVVVLVAALVAAASAMAAPAPKATGGIGFSDASRSFAFKFDAIQSSDKPITLSNIAGVTSFDFQLNGDPTNGHYIHNAALTQTGQSISGMGSYAVGEAWGNSWEITAATVVGNKLDLTWEYVTGPAGVPGVTHHMIGNIAPDGSLVGTWSDNYVEGGSPAPATTRTGTFTATGATSTTYSAKGLAFYSDANDYYVLAVRAVNVANTEAWFAGEVVDTNRSDWTGDWASFQVQDNGQGGTATTTDKLWGAFADSQTAALATVTDTDIPSTGGIDSAEYSITSGNLQVH